jgi:hypothetical protein
VSGGDDNVAGPSQGGQDDGQGSAQNNPGDNHGQTGTGDDGGSGQQSPGHGGGNGQPGNGQDDSSGQQRNDQGQTQGQAPGDDKEPPAQKGSGQGGSGGLADTCQSPSQAPRASVPDERAGQARNRPGEVSAQAVDAREGDQVHPPNLQAGAPGDQEVQEQPAAEALPARDGGGGARQAGLEAQALLAAGGDAVEQLSTDAGDAEIVELQYSGPLANVLPFDLSALEADVKNFFEQMDDLVVSLGETPIELLLPSGLLAVATAIAVEIARRQTHPAGLALTPSRPGDRRSSIPCPRPG